MVSLEPDALEPPPSPEVAAALPTAESRGQRLARHAHRTRLYAGAVVFVGLLTVLVILIANNTGGVKLDWAIGSTHASLVWIILAAAVLGWLLGVTTAVVFQHRTRRP